VKFYVQIQRNLKVKKSEVEFLKGKNIFLGIFKLASTYYVKQQTSNRVLHLKEKGDFYHFKLLL